MAQPLSRPLTEAELRRFEDCADENAKLAECWESDQVVVVAFERSDAENRYAGISKTPALSIGIMTPIEKPAPGAPGSRERKKPQTTRQLAQRTISVLERVKVDKKFAPKPYYSKYLAHERFDMYAEEARAKARETIEELAGRYVTVCLAGYDLRETRQAMETFGVRAPARAVFVDLVKVLEHQTRDAGIPKELRKYTDENVTVRNGRYDRRPGEPQGPNGMPSVRLLEVLGPAAAGHRADFKKIEKGSVALKRIADRARNGVP